MARALELEAGERIRGMKAGERMATVRILLALESTAVGGALFTNWHWAVRGFMLTAAFLWAGMLYRAVKRWF